MVDATLKPASRRPVPQIEFGAWSQLKSNRNWLGYWFMLPALALLILFLAYPLGSRRLALVHGYAHRTQRRVRRVGELRVAAG